MMAAIVHGSGFSKQDLMKIGKAKAFNNKKRRLSAFFRFTREEGDHAQTWNSKGKFVPALITLTYPDNSVWQPEHITDFINNLRNYASRKWGVTLRYAWVAEATKKGVIHYHIVTWHPRKHKFPKPDKQGWWKHGGSKIEGVRKGVYSYLLKYISKSQDLDLCRYNDKGKKVKVRTFSYGGLSPHDREFLSHQMLPKYIKRIFGPIPFGAKIRRVKGGWECKELNVSVVSNWDCSFSEDTGHWYYYYGRFWEELPDEPLEDVWHKPVPLDHIEVPF